MTPYVRATSGALVNLDQAAWVEATDKAYNHETKDLDQSGVVARFLCDRVYQFTLEVCDSLEHAKARLKDHWEPLLTRKTP